MPSIRALPVETCPPQAGSAGVRKTNKSVTSYINMQFSITDKALAKLKTSATNEGVDLNSVMLRVAVIPGGCSGLTYDLGWDTSLTDTDETTEVEGIRVVMDLKSRLYVDGSALDFGDGLEGKGFHFDNPQAIRTCACGESFGL